MDDRNTLFFAEGAGLFRIIPALQPQTWNARFNGFPDGSFALAFGYCDYGALDRVLHLLKRRVRLRRAQIDDGYTSTDMPIGG